MTYLVDEFNEVSARPLVIRWDMMDEFEDVDIFNIDASVLYISILNDMRDSPNNPSFIYVIYIDKEFEVGTDYLIGGMAPYASIIVVLEPSLINSISEKNVLLHEMGHLFGLEHCNDRNCIMYPELRADKLVGFCDDCIDLL